MKLNTEFIKKLTRSIVSTRDEELGCEDCFEVVDIFVENELQGKKPSEAMPLVEEHLSRCANCREEFEALLDAIKATSEEE